jgi:hypothetical protein
MPYSTKEIQEQLKKYLTMTNITQEDFNAYVSVQKSGVTNMFNVSVVSDYSGLRKDQIMEIMKNYADLHDKYGN